MAVAYGKPRMIDITTYEIPFSTNRTPPIHWRVCVDGVVRSEYTSSQTADAVRLSVQPGEGVSLEVLDSQAAILSPAFPGRLTLNWTAVPRATKYHVQEFVAGQWVHRQSVIARGETAFLWQTRWLENHARHRFRVIPVTEGEAEGEPVEFIAYMARAETVPVVNYSYDSNTGDVTISNV